MNPCMRELFDEAAATGDRTPRVYVYLPPELAHLEWSVVTALIEVLEDAFGASERRGGVSLSSTCGCDDISFSLGTGAGEIFIQTGAHA